MLVVIFPALTHSQKPFIPSSQSISVGFVITTFWQKYLFAMHLLNAMSQHRPIHFFQNIFPNMYLVIRAPSTSEEFEGWQQSHEPERQLHEPEEKSHKSVVVLAESV